MKVSVQLCVVALYCFGAAILSAQTGSIEGRVTLTESGDGLGGAEVLIVELGREVLSTPDGGYRFDNVPPGSYQLLSHLDSIFTQEALEIVVRAEQTTTADFSLALAALHHEITVTAGDKQQTAFESFQSVDSLDSFELAENTDVSLGEVLGSRVGSGVSKRSFGPGSSRPIVRGFDGDRVLVMQDGIRVGSLASQSGDHGEPLNMAQVDRLEVVKGPATLLYGSNAMGGTINAISRHHSVHVSAHQGLRGYVSGSAGTANALGGSNAGFEYGAGKWMVWGYGGGIRSSDYSSPAGEIFNSRTRQANGGGGLGYYGKRYFFSVEAQADDGRYGVPFAQEIHDEGGDAGGHEEEEELERIALDTRRQAYHLSWGVRELGGGIDNFTLKLRYIDWEHDEVEFFADGGQEVGTAFEQKQFIYRGVFEQRQRGSLTGRFGFWGLERSYDVVGEEALSPPIDQTAVALFVLEEVELERIKFQFGGRVETNRYRPAFADRGFDLGGEANAPAVKRRFTGGSASVGLHADLWKDGAFVTSYAHTYRAPALEELYNFGPHVGNLAFEIGDPRLQPETGDGLDVSLRHEDKRLRGELNFFYYGFDNFVFPFANGEIEDGLRVVEFRQSDARFLGSEASLALAVKKDVWVNFGLDYVNAEETQAHTPLPRIPPLRGRIGLDVHYKNLSVKPELTVASRQGRTFTGETETPGYAVAGLKASYTIPQGGSLAHQFSLNVFNIGDVLYRNHASFIKDLAPEIGRGVRIAYVLRFF